MEIVSKIPGGLDGGTRTFQQRQFRQRSKEKRVGAIEPAIREEATRARGKWKKLRDLSMKSDNRICADCSAPDPKWVSANIGVFLCLKCSEVHRSLGVDTSKVLSLTLDEWSESDMESVIEVGGNSYANSIYEAFLPRNYPKPKPDSSEEDRTKFIRSKYVLQEFLTPSLRIVSTKSSFQYVESSKSSASTFGSKSTKKNVSDHLSTSVSRFVSTVSLLKAQTTVKNSNLNPVWNEELTFSIPPNYGALKLQVYDHDVISADDIMGEAEIDLQAMITAALAFGDSDIPGNMQVGKWLKTSDNALVEDSLVNIVDGRIKQELHLKLQNVESGEMELELEWLPLDE
ncbi:hypothetical protein ZIOFF_044505 [Zingiber officinale]|uniref:ADP-ribosylation factor GTPase-activating protein AGD12 n=1 Tax=Zingiber officinale TaxID=94328 RepID=A0A8J5FXA7_ZINOF|nr:hypothetical protein ZIOFF_044505 [Zingiber officinale]